MSISPVTSSGVSGLPPQGTRPSGPAAGTPAGDRTAAAPDRVELSPLAQVAGGRQEEWQLKLSMEQLVQLTTPETDTATDPALKTTHAAPDTAKGR